MAHSPVKPGEQRVIASGRFWSENTPTNAPALVAVTPFRSVRKNKRVSKTSRHTPCVNGCPGWPCGVCGKGF